jgi:hypothetical protein
MVSLATARKLALSFEGAEEMPHFEKPSFRVKKKIFLTLDEKNNKACIRLDEINQDIFCKIDPTIIYPVANKWGAQGWTYIELKLVSNALLKEALLASYCTVAPKALAMKYKLQ